MSIFNFFILDAKSREIMAKRSICEECCDKNCLLRCGLSFDVVQAIVTSEQADIIGLSMAEKRDMIRDKIKACIIPQDGNKYYKYNWKLGDPRKAVIEGVCRQCFCNLNQIGHTYLEERCKELKSFTNNSEVSE